MVEELLVFSRRPIADSRMQTLLIIHFFEEVADAIFGFFQRLVLVEIDLLIFEGFHEAFGFGIIIRIAGASHADINSDLFERSGVRV